jgi:hypothetical protein
MARIRNVKPEFFRHEGLQDLEQANPGKYPMLVFEGLWTKCDRQGVFEWKPRSLKLDILPFLPFDMEEVLGILEAAGFIKKYEAEGNAYGIIPSFLKHQKISLPEQKNRSLFPLPPNPPKTDAKQEEPTGEPFQNPSRTPLEPFHNHSRTPLEGFQNPYRTPLEGFQNTGVRSTEVRSTEILNSEVRSTEIPNPEKDTDPPDICDLTNPQNLFLHIWQHNGDVFNITAPIESPKDWRNFWEKSTFTCEQVKNALENFIQDVHSGEIEQRFVPSLPDRFVLKGWLQKCQKRFKTRNKVGPPLPDQDQEAKKFL